MKGRFLKVSLARRIICDFIRASRDVAHVPIERRMLLAPLVAARNWQSPRVSWVAVFLKAFARLSADHPELRRHFVAWPWERYYESPHVQAAVAIERDIMGETGILLALCRDPARMSLREIDSWLMHHKHSPVNSVESYRLAIRIASYPSVIRRLIWGVGRSWLGQVRSDLIGTFGITVTSGLGAATLAVRTPWTTALHYGVIEPDGTIPVRITFDHRVVDGAFVARILAELEDVLLGDIAEELQFSNAYDESTTREVPVTSRY